MLPVGSIEVRRHKAILARLDAGQPISDRLVEPRRGTERTARHFQRPDQRGQHGARPAALVSAPAVVHRLAKDDGNRAERQHAAPDLDRFSDAGIGEVLVRHPAHGRGRHVAQRRRPFRRVGTHLLDESRECRRAGGPFVLPIVAVGADFDAILDREISLQCRNGTASIKRHRSRLRACPKATAYGCADRANSSRSGRPDTVRRCDRVRKRRPSTPADAREATRASSRT